MESANGTINAAIDLEKLNIWLIEQGLGGGEIVNPTLLGGGTQNIIIKFERNGREMVLRRPPLHQRTNSNETMRREIRMLDALASTNVPHPRLIIGCSDDSIFGFSFYLMEPIEGFAPISGLRGVHATDRSIQRRMGFSFVEGIISLGAVDHKKVGLSDFGNPENFLERQVSRWQFQLESYKEHDGWPGAEDIPGIDVVASWLQRNCPASFEPGIIHGDYHLGNVMYHYDSPELAAIVDWELTTIGDPLLDLGWLIATWPQEGKSAIDTLTVKPWIGFPSSNELVQHYRNNSDRDLSAVDWYTVLACYKLGIILEGTYARSFVGKASEKDGIMLHQSTINLFNIALKYI